MSLPTFVTVAVLVTLAGVLVVLACARIVAARAPHASRHIALACLALYAAVLLTRPGSWPLIDVAVLLGGIGGALLLERTLPNLASVAAFVAVAAVVDMLSM